MASVLTTEQHQNAVKAINKLIPLTHVEVLEVLQRQGGRIREELASLAPPSGGYKPGWGDFGVNPDKPYVCEKYQHMHKWLKENGAKPVGDPFNTCSDSKSFPVYFQRFLRHGATSHDKVQRLYWSYPQAKMLEELQKHGAKLPQLPPREPGETKTAASGEGGGDNDKWTKHKKAKKLKEKEAKKQRDLEARMEEIYANTVIVPDKCFNCPSKGQFDRETHELQMLIDCDCAEASFCSTRCQRDYWERGHKEHCKWLQLHKDPITNTAKIQAAATRVEKVRTKRSAEHRPIINPVLMKLAEVTPSHTISDRDVFICLPDSRAPSLTILETKSTTQQPAPVGTTAEAMPTKPSPAGESVAAATSTSTSSTTISDNKNEEDEEEQHYTEVAKMANQVLEEVMGNAPALDYVPVKSKDLDELNTFFAKRGYKVINRLQQPDLSGGDEHKQEVALVRVKGLDNPDYVTKFYCEVDPIAAAEYEVKEEQQRLEFEKRKAKVAAGLDAENLKRDVSAHSQHDEDIMPKKGPLPVFSEEFKLKHGIQDHTPTSIENKAAVGANFKTPLEMAGTQKEWPILYVNAEDLIRIIPEPMVVGEQATISVGNHQDTKSDTIQFRIFAPNGLSRYWWARRLAPGIVCNSCGKTEPKPKRCRGCLDVAYCSTICQRNHRVEHLLTHMRCR